MTDETSDKVSNLLHIAWSKGDPVGLATGTSKFIDSYQGFSQLYDRDKGLTHPKKIVTSIQPWLYYPPTNPYSNGQFTKAPGKYTGEMRKVIQAMIANGQYLHYEYKAALCHGVYTADNDDKWVIEIGTNGVYAAKMPLSEVAYNSSVWLGYAPLGTTIPISSWEGYRQLLTAAQISVFYTKSILFSACGWAFNSAGSKASNTCYVGGFGGPYGTPSEGYVYTIDIGESGNEPTSAGITETESGSYALLRDRGLKHPTVGEDAIELDLSGHENGQQVIGGFSAPRYVFYTNDALTVVRSKGISGNRDTGDGELVDSLPQPYGVYNAHYGGVTPCGFPDEAEAFLLGIGASGTYHVNLDGSSTASSGTVVDGQEVRPSVYGRSIRCSFSTLFEVEGMVIYYGGPTGHPMKWQQNSWEISVDGARSVSFIIIPIGDREAVYQFHDQVESEGCFGVVKDMLVGNTGMHRESGGFSECAIGCKDTIETAHTQFRKSGDIIWNRYKVPPLWGACTTTCSNAYDPPSLPGYSHGSMESKGAIRRQQLWYIDGSGIYEQLWSTTSGITNDEFSDPTSSYTQDTIPEYPQWMYAHRDNTQSGVAFFAKYMNATNGSDQYVMGVDTEKYPIATITSSLTINCFWAGDPHCVDNNCD